MARMVSPARRPAALPASKTSATMFGPESYIVPVSASATLNFIQWVGTVAGGFQGLISRPRLRFREALLFGVPSPGERSHDEEQRGDTDRGLREDVAVERVEGLRPGERNVPDQEPSDEQVPAVAVHHPLDPA